MEKSRNLVENQKIAMPVVTSLGARRASTTHAMLSRSAPDSAMAMMTLDSLGPGPFGGRRASLPPSPSCSVATQTPTDVVQFIFPEAFESLEMHERAAYLDRVMTNRYHHHRRTSSTSTSTSVGTDYDYPSPSSSPEGEVGIWTHCLQRLNSQDKILSGRLMRRVSFHENPMEFKEKMQGVGVQLRSIADDFERCRLSRSRSVSYSSFKKTRC